MKGFDFFFMFWICVFATQCATVSHPTAREVEEIVEKGCKR